MKPYYDHAGITIFHGDAREILPSLGPVDLVLTDPPYGIGASTQLRANTQHGQAKAVSKDYGASSWDKETINQADMDDVVCKAKNSIVFGGNYYKFAPNSCWLVWDKNNGSNGYADCELAWTNLQKAVRLFKYTWQGMLQQHMGEAKEFRYHPTQKPVPVMQWCITQAPDTVQTILDPFMGSGTTLVAAKNLGRKAIGIEIEEKYCEIAARRLAQEVLFT